MIFILIALVFFGHNSFAEIYDIDLSDQSKWFCFGYGSRPQSQYKFSTRGMEIKVNSSTGPCLYKLDKISKIKNIKIVAESNAKFLLMPSQIQGEEDFDDYALRVGLVLVGDTRPVLVIRWFLPRWVQKLIEVAPEGLGFEHVQFFTTTQTKSLVGREKTHFGSKYFKEKASVLIGPKESFTIEEDLRMKSWEVYALWVMADGDDLNKKFTTTLKSIRVER